MELLIRKTWVEKADEINKEELQSRIPALITFITGEDYQKALEELGKILEELAYLFFGSECEEEDFIEYTLRIDLQMGLFWWYGSKIGSAEFLEWTKSAEKGNIWALLLLGICYLADF
ncbi:MAG: hypothetical protein LBG76_07515 [Treponema sp.]|nr:hypothetical protein [Treponema sp.]